MELAPGVLVTDDIRLIRRLGEGGMGSVWEAEHLKLNATVAIKILSAEAADQSKTAVARFKREALAASRIKSPHVVQMFDSGALLDGTPYIAMEMLEGEDLAERIERGGALPLAELLPIVTQTAKALAKAHDQGIVHRDVKPDNVFLTDESGDTFVKVLDFGIAKRFDVKTHSVVTLTGTMVGTPAYMSPEQVLSGKDVDARTDVWSLGVLAYHALAGDIPFRGDTLGAMCVAIAAGDFKPITAVRNDLPRSLDGWFARMLAVKPGDRFQSARAAADALQSAANEMPAMARTTVVMSHDAHGDAETDRGVRRKTLAWLTASIELPMKKTPVLTLAVAGVVALAVVATLTFSMTTGDEHGQAAGAELRQPKPPLRLRFAEPGAERIADQGSASGPTPSDAAAPLPPRPALPPRAPTPPKPSPPKPAKVEPKPVDRGF